MVTIFSHDPGTTNYGYSVVEAQLDGGKVKFRVRENGLNHSTIRALNSTKERSKEREEYLQFLKRIKDTFHPTALCAERFMSRGGKGPTIEQVNIMIGVLENSKIFYPMMVTIMPAAVWKNAYHRAGIDLKAEYKRIRTTPHQLDASLIGIWLAHKGYGFKDFGDTDIVSLWDTILDQIEATSTERLINRKNINR